MNSDVFFLMVKAILIYLLVLWSHSLRHRVGLAPFYVLLGGLTAIMSWVTDAGVQVNIAGITFVVGSVVFYTSLLLGVFVLYVFDGPRHARAAIATVAGMSALTPLIAASLQFEGGPLDGIPMPGLRVNIASVLTTMIDLVFLGCAWEFLGHPFFKLKLWRRAFLTLLGVMILDVILFSTTAFAGTPAYLRILQGTLVSRVMISVVASLILYAYLAREVRRCGTDLRTRPVLSILREMEDIRGELLTLREQRALRRRLAQAQALAQTTLDALPDRIAIVGEDGRIVSANQPWVEFAHEAGYLDTYNPIGLDYFNTIEPASGLLDTPSMSFFVQGLRAVLAGEKDFHEQACRFDCGTIHSDFVVRIIPLTSSDARQAILVYTDQTERELAHRRQQLLIDIFNRLNKRGNRKVVLKETLTLIRQHTGIESVGLRLRDGEDFPYAVAEGYSDAFLEKERSLCVQDPQGRVLCDETGAPVLSCICGCVLTGQSGAFASCVTEGGSFWTNSTTDLFAGVDLCSIHPMMRDQCNAEGYESVAMVPLRAGQEIIGLLQLNDRRRDLFSEERLRFLEQLGTAIGVEVQQAQTEEALRESENNLRHVITSIRDGLWDWNILEDCVTCSPQWFQMLGYEPNEFRVDWPTCEKLFHPDDVLSVEEALRVYLCGETELYSAEFRMRSKGGAYVWIWARGSLVERTADGEPARMIGVHVNMTEAHVAQDELKESEERYRQLFDSMQSGFALHEILCDESGAPCDYRFVEVNAAFEVLTGLKEEELIGHTVKEVLPEVEPHWIRIFGQVALTGAATSIEEFSMDLGRYYSVSAYSPSPGKFAAIFHDVTDQKLAEKAMERARDAAEEANRAKTRFMANMSHELRTPLNAIIGLSELLDDTPLNEEQLDYARTIGTSGEALLSLVSDLLDLSKIEMDKMNIEKADFNVAEVVENSMAMLSAFAAQKNTELNYTIGADVPETVCGDADRVQQVLVNLLNNAVKFIGEGDRIQVAVRSSLTPAQKRRVEFVVQDNGVGMDSETAARIFEPFQQGDSSNTREYGGVGLGLAICKELAEAMGGGISVESAPGEGATFRFSILDYTIP